MDLKKELQLLKQRQKQIMADYQAVNGAIQFCEHLIQQQEKDKEVENENNTD